MVYILIDTAAEFLSSDFSRVLLAANTIDVLAINEPRLDSSIHDSEMHIGSP